MTSLQRSVRVVDRSGDPWFPRVVEVTVPWVCCTCGEARGEPFGHNFHEDDVWMHCDRWENPCGHIDKYADVLKQARSKT